MKDQASKLREMIQQKNQKQQEKCLPVAVFSCVANDNEKEWIEEITSAISTTHQKRVIYIDTDTHKEDIKFYIEKPGSFKRLQDDFSRSYVQLSESFDTMYKLIREDSVRTEYIQHLREIEQDKEVLVYYCGNFINAKTMNLMSLSSSIVLLVDDTQSSIERAVNVLKVQRKIQEHANFILLTKPTTRIPVLTYLQEEMKHHQLTQTVVECSKDSLWSELRRDNKAFSERIGLLGR